MDLLHHLQIVFTTLDYIKDLRQELQSRASLSTGANSMQLLHSATGNTNTVEFVKDNLTASPTVDQWVVQQ